MANLCSSRTLQELIAPSEVFFYGSAWNALGSSRDLFRTIATYSNIHATLLSGETPLEDFSIAQRMSWAAFRRTSRVEDIAYCLLGIFDVNMPLLYGEREKAFSRLQEEIIRSTTDQSVFAWHSYPNTSSTKYLWDVSPLLARSPDDFRHGGDIVYVDDFLDRSAALINQRGLQATLSVVQVNGDITYAFLNCVQRDSERATRLALRLRAISSVADSPYVVATNHDFAGLGRLAHIVENHLGVFQTHRTITILKYIRPKEFHQLVYEDAGAQRPRALAVVGFDDCPSHSRGIHSLEYNGKVYDLNPEDEKAGLRIARQDSLIYIHVRLRTPFTYPHTYVAGQSLVVIVALGNVYRPRPDGIHPFEGDLAIFSSRGPFAGSLTGGQVDRTFFSRRHLWPIEMDFPLGQEVEWESACVLRARLTPSVPPHDGTACLALGVFEGNCREEWPGYEVVRRRHGNPSHRVQDM